MGKDEKKEEKKVRYTDIKIGPFCGPLFHTQHLSCLNEYAYPCLSLLSLSPFPSLRDPLSLSSVLHLRPIVVLAPLTK